MEFSNTGVHCEFDSCRQRDYLPFDCNRCQHKFCLSHRTREQHECPSLAIDDAAARARGPPAPIALPPKFKCHKKGCKTKELQAINCRNCSHNFCIAHRFPTSHACESFGQGVNRNTILKAGILPARPLDKHNSTDSSTEPIAGPARPTPAAAPISVSCNPLPLALPTASSTAVSIAAAASSSPSSVLVHSNAVGQSCAAELAAALASGSQAALAAAQSSGSISSDSVAPNAADQETAPTNATHAVRRTNTNVAHLSKLLKQHS